MDALKFPTALVMGFLPRPHRILSVWHNGHKLSPEKGQIPFSSALEDWLQQLKTRKSEEIQGNPSRCPILFIHPLTIDHMMKTMLLYWGVVRYLSSVSSFDLFPENWFLKCSPLLVNQGTATPKALLCELFSLGSCVSCFYPSFSSYFHIKFHLLCSDPVSQHIWHAFDLFFFFAACSSLTGKSKHKKSAAGFFVQVIYTD